jgi:tRNA G18 (ribose-2'-O)-methylase SpoU
VATLPTGAVSASAQPITIGDPDDPRVDAYRHLTDADLRRHLETRLGLFVVEGELAVRRLVANERGWPVRSVLMKPEKSERLADVVEAAGRLGAPVYLARSEVFDLIAGYHVHRGVLALAERMEFPSDPLEVVTGSTVLVVEGVNDHENLGALFRNAAALGGSAVLMDPSCCDPLYRRAVRVSVGQVLRIPFARFGPGDWPAGLRRLSAAGFTVVALTPTADTTVTGLGEPAKVALVVGSEGGGLSDAALGACDMSVRIPMADGVDSLNVATSAAIALHRLAR